MTTSDEALHIRVQAHIGAIIFILLVAGALTALFLFAGFYEVSRGIDMRAIVFLVLGLVGVWVVYRVYSYYFKPQFSVMADRVVARGFIRPAKTLLFSDTDGWRTEVQVVTHAIVAGRRRKLATPLNIEHLIQTDKLGNETKVTLPRYLGANAEVLARIATLSGRMVSQGNPA